MKGVVIDTNVLVSALISQNGASYKLLASIDAAIYVPCISVALVLEYEDVLKRLSGSRIALTMQQIDAVIDYVCAKARRHAVYFLWRPTLPDPKDDMLLELAVSAQVSTILTYNLSDFRGVELFGVRAITPKTFLQEQGVLS